MATKLSRSTNRPSPATAPARKPARRAWALGLFATSLVLVLIPIAWLQADPQGLRVAEDDFRRGESSRALRKALKHLDTHALGRRRASLIAAKSLSQLDQPDRADAYYQRAGGLSLEDQHIRAFAIVRANQRAKAIEMYRRILHEFPDDVLALRRLAGVHMSNTEYIEAMEIAERLMKLPDGRAIGHTLSGLIYHRTGYTDQSVAQFRRVLELDPGLKAMPLDPPWQFWAFLTEDLLSLGRSPEARTYLERALETLPDARLAGLLGRAYHQEGDLAAAERTWRKAKEWDPELAGPWLELGKLALNQDRPAEALELLERAEALKPGSPATAYSLSLAHRRLGHLPEAERFAARADELRRRARAPLKGMAPSPSPSE